MTLDTSSAFVAGSDRAQDVRRFAAGAALYAVLVAVHAACALPMQEPALFADELGYLGNARYLAGVAPMPRMETTTFYHFGYSLLLLPAFRIIEDPGLAYRAVMLINAFLMSLIFPALYYTLHAGFGAPRRLAVLIAFVTSLYPAFVLHSVFAWAENALIPGYACLIAAFAALLNRYAPWKVLLVCVLAAFLYTIHPRALPLLPVVALCLVALAMSRTVPWGAVAAGIAAMGVIYAATELTGDHLRALGWSSERTARSVATIVARPLSFSGLANLTISTAGQLLYLAAASCGVALVPCLYVLSGTWRKDIREAGSPQGERRAWLAAIIAMSSLSLFAASATFIWAGGRRADHVIYGRYNEAFLGIYVALGLLLLCRRPRRLAWTALLVPASIAALTIVVLTTRGALLTRPLVPTNVIGIYPSILAMGHIDLVVTSLASVVLFLIVAALCRWTLTGGLVAISLVFAGGTAYTYRSEYRPAREAIARGNVLPPYIRALGRGLHLSVDVSALHGLPNRYYSYQYLLPDATIDRFNSANGESPMTAIVISHRYWPGAERLAARLVTAEPGSDLALWLLPSARHYLSASQSYIGVALGWRRFPGVWESGFQSAGRGTRFRWARGRARLVVPVNEFPTRLTVNLRPAAPDVRVRIVVNGTVLFDAADGSGPRTLDLASCPVTDWVTIEILSEAVPDGRRGHAASDRRDVGVAVREIRLLRD
jgi:hypothetical protein